MKLINEFERAGWDPFDPSEECRTATAIPEMPNRISEHDCLGIYREYLYLILLSRFGRGSKDGDRRRSGLWAFSMLFALRRTEFADRLTPSILQEWLDWAEVWRRDVLAPTLKRIDGADAREVIKNQASYEPGFTWIFIVVNMGLMDVDRDQEMMSLGLAMHEENDDRPKQPRKPATSTEISAYLELLTSKDNTIARVSDTGMLEIDPLQVKRWMETRLGGVLQARGAGLGRYESADTDIEEIVTALAAAEQVQRIHEIRDSRLRDAEEGTPRWHVLQCFFELAQGELSFRDLSDRVGVPRTTLQDAFATEREAIAQALRAA